MFETCSFWCIFELTKNKYKGGVMTVLEGLLTSSSILLIMFLVYWFAQTLYYPIHYLF